MTNLHFQMCLCHYMTYTMLDNTPTKPPKLVLVLLQMESQAEIVYRHLQTNAQTHIRYVWMAHACATNLEITSLKMGSVSEMVRRLATQQSIMVTWSVWVRSYHVVSNLLDRKGLRHTWNQWKYCVFQQILTKYGALSGEMWAKATAFSRCVHSPPMFTELLKIRIKLKYSNACSYIKCFGKVH